MPDADGLKTAPDSQSRRYDPFKERVKPMDPLDELKIVQDVITKQEELCFKVFSWAIGLITALTIGFFHNSVKINPWVYMICGFTIIVGYFLVARYHWVTFFQAVTRSCDIEEEIKTDNYKRVKINETLKAGNDLNFFINYRFYGPYAILIIIVIVLGISGLGS